jgi:hypothetical protein
MILSNNSSSAPGTKYPSAHSFELQTNVSLHLTVHSFPFFFFQEADVSVLSAAPHELNSTGIRRPAHGLDLLTNISFIRLSARADEYFPSFNFHQLSVLLLL